ncbi:MAG: hypothetical protein PUE60_05535 [Eubacteriales bacterium]|nr:hypothetical protein [Eubacteriales bacterium]
MNVLTAIFALILIFIFVIISKKNAKKQEKVKSKVSADVMAEIDKGAIPIFEYDLNYNVGEVCYFVDNAKYFTYKEVTYYQNISDGKNDRCSTTVPWTYNKTNRYKGEIIITNQRVIFNGDGCCVSVNLNGIITCKSVERKIIINSSTGIYEIYVANSGSIEKLIKNIIKFNKGELK